jgi:hypothetical protein
MAAANTFGTRTGNHIVIELDDIQVGLIQSMRGSDDFGLEPVSGIGSIKVKEYVPTVARHQIQCGFVALKTELIASRSFASEDGDKAMEGLIFDIIVYDKRDTGVNPDSNQGYIKKYTGCSYASGDFSIEAHRAVIRNATFMALDVDGGL